MPLMSSGTCPVLVTVTVCVAGDEKPTASLVKVRLVGKTVTDGKLAPEILVTKASPLPAYALRPSTGLAGATGSNGKSDDLVLPAR
jgi:ABC-type Zn2+ transport system substrate-binding protein/surface adhesin